MAGKPLRVELWGRQDGEPTSVRLQLHRNGKVLVDREIEVPGAWTSYALLSNARRGSYQIYLYGGGGWNGHALTIRVLPRQKPAAWRSCGDQPGMGAGYYNVQARNIGCRKAKAVARKWFWGGGSVTGEFWGFSCTSRQTGIETSRVRCVRLLGSGRRQVVKFEAGA